LDSEFVVVQTVPVFCILASDIVKRS